MPDGVLDLGACQFDLARRQLLRHGEPVSLGSRATDILCVLIAAKGQLVTKDELMAQVWRDLVVAENNIHVHVLALRKALGCNAHGQGRIVTVPGRGYRLMIDDRQAPEDGHPSSRRQAADKPSIAVLAFDNMSGDPEQTYFADGVVEEIITALSRIAWLQVTARNSSFAYRDKPAEIKRIGHELGARYIVEGSVRKSGNQVRLTAQLIEAVTGAHLWADRFQGALADVFAFQDHVAESIAGVIEPTLQAAEYRRSCSRPTSDLSAYDLYPRAHYEARLWESRGYQRSVDLLAQAIGRDPLFGRALSLRAYCESMQWVAGWSADPDTTHRQAIEDAHRALRAPDDDPDVFGRSAYVFGVLGEDINAAIALADRALRINPSYAAGWYYSGWIRLWAGHGDEAVDHFAHAARLSPYEEGKVLFGVGLHQFLNHHYGEAASTLLRSIQEFPAWAPTYRALAACYARLGRLDDARKAIAQLRLLSSLVIPSASQLRDPKQREFFLDSLRLAVMAPT